MWSGRNNPSVGPGDPYPFEGKVNPYRHLLKKRGFDITPARERDFVPRHDAVSSLEIDSVYRDRLWRGTTTIQAADAEGWIVSVTPSGGLDPCLHCR